MSVQAKDLEWNSPQPGVIALAPAPALGQQTTFVKTAPPESRPAGPATLGMDLVINNSTALAAAGAAAGSGAPAYPAAFMLHTVHSISAYPGYLTDVKV